MSHQSRLIPTLLICLICLKCDIIYTPLYMCATQTTLNRLKQPKNLYSVSTCIRQQFQPDLSLCAAAKLANMSIIVNSMEHYLCKWRVLKEQASYR